MLVTTLGVALALISADTTGRCVAHPGHRGGVPVPVEYADGRYFAVWSIPGGATLRLYLDTGGPRDQLFAGAVARLGLQREVAALDDDSVSWVRIPAAIAARISPSIRNNDWLDGHPVRDGSVRVMAAFPGSGLDALASDGPDGSTVDGILGPDWFGGRVWTLDYPGGRLLRDTTGAPALPPECWVALGFQVDSSGARTTNFPRISAVIDGDTLDFLVDAGAMTTPTDRAAGVLGVRAGRTIAASFIVHSLFDRWRTRHPDWPVIADADRRYHDRMIRVPDVTVGGMRLGPVWFSERPDASFHSFMSQWMDRRIDGALGGSAWHNVVLVLDYPGGRAAMLQPASR